MRSSSEYHSKLGGRRCPIRVTGDRICAREWRRSSTRNRGSRSSRKGSGLEAWDKPAQIMVSFDVTAYSKAGRVSAVGC